MPGICGALGADNEQYSNLRHEFSRPWTDCQFVSFPGGFIGGHTFGPTSAVQTLNESCHFAVDGEASIYSFYIKQDNGAGSFRTSQESLHLTEAFKGNVVWVDLRSRICRLEAEQTGTFPLYYTLTASGQLLFSSSLKPLAKVIHASPDLVGISEFVTWHHTFHRRTYFQNVFRLLPGQVLTYHLDTRRLDIQAPRVTWVGNKKLSADEVDCEVLWHSLKTAVKSRFDSEKRHALMMSAGWDSRLLLCAMLEHLGSNKIVAYTYGDMSSHELQVVNQICQSTGVECILEPLNDSLYELGFLERTFNRLENVRYPQWHRASEQLSGIGVQSISAGVYGEVLGGHYGPEIALRGIKKGIHVGGSLIGIPILFNSFERLRHPGKPRTRWFLTKGARADVRDASREMNNEVEAVWLDLEQLGVKNREQLIEAFVALTRGSRLINQQILSCRANLEIAVPFIDFDLLKLVSQIPQSVKIHNSMSRKILQRYGASLLRFPTGATLVPASMSIFSQEASRVIRWQRDKIADKLSGSPRLGLGYWGLDFLRNGRSLRTILDDLRSDIWDRDVIEQSIKNVAEHKEANMYDIHTDFLTMYTMDLMLR